MQNTHVTVSTTFSKCMMIIVRVKLEAEVGFSVKGLFKAAFQLSVLYMHVQARKSLNSSKQFVFTNRITKVC